MSKVIFSVFKSVFRFAVFTPSLAHKNYSKISIDHVNIMHGAYRVFPGPSFFNTSFEGAGGGGGMREGSHYPGVGPYGPFELLPTLLNISVSVQWLCASRSNR